MLARRYLYAYGWLASDTEKERAACEHETKALQLDKLLVRLRPYIVTSAAGGADALSGVAATLPDFQALHTAAEATGSGPFVGWENLCSMQATRGIIEGLGRDARAEADVKLEAQKFDETLKHVTALLEALRCAVALCAKEQRQEAATERKAQAAERREQHREEARKRKAAEAQGKEDAAKRRTAGAVNVSRSDIFDGDMATIPHFVPMPRHVEANILKDNNADYGGPFIVEACEWIKREFGRNDPELDKHRAEFEERFPKSLQYKQSGKAHKTTASLDGLVKVLEKAVRPPPTKGAVLLGSNGLEQAKNHCAADGGFSQGALFVYHPSMKYVGPETREASSVRYQESGCKDVLAVPFLTAEALVSSQGEPQPDLRTILDYLAGLTVATAKEFKLAAGERLFFGTVGPQELLYVPLGHLVVERVNNNTPLMGVRAGFLWANAQLLTHFEKLCAAMGRARAGPSEALAERKAIVAAFKARLRPS
jgi:hypothetical protein